MLSLLLFCYFLYLTIFNIPFYFVNVLHIINLPQVPVIFAIFNHP